MALFFKILIISTFVVWIWWPTKSKSQHDLWMRRGLRFSVFVNLMLFLRSLSEAGAKWVDAWLFPMFLIPAFLTFPLVAIVVLTKLSLKGEKASYEWGMDDAALIVARDSSSTRQALARAYIAATPFAAFFGGWAIGSLLFARVVFNKR